MNVPVMLRPIKAIGSNVPPPQVYHHASSVGIGKSIDSTLRGARLEQLMIGWATGAWLYLAGSPHGLQTIRS